MQRPAHPEPSLTCECAAHRALPLAVEHTQAAQAGALGHAGIPATDDPSQVGAMAVTLVRLLDQYKTRVRKLIHPVIISVSDRTDVPTHN